jgi:cyanophycinase
MEGHLVIAGGNIRSRDIYKEFIQLAGGDRASIAIVPTAAENTAAALEKLSDVFEVCGVNKERIVRIKINPDMREDSEWKISGEFYECLDFMEDVTGVWFCGGDQNKIARGFLREDDTDTKLLGRVREIVLKGGVVGGSSAGAAIMGKSMIGGGTSEGALSEPHCRDYVEYRQKPELEEAGVLLLTKGLGFFECGIIDQHFEERRRHGRLIEALFAEEIPLGYGISEDTAMVCNLESKDIRVIGSGRVTIINISEGVRKKVRGFSEFENIKIIHLEDGGLYKIPWD